MKNIGKKSIKKYRRILYNYLRVLREEMGVIYLYVSFHFQGGGGMEEICLCNLVNT
jgi:hypothetical protein